MKTGTTKQELVDSLASTLRLTRVGVVDLELVSSYEPEDTVIIYLEGGQTRVSIACDSGIAIIRDVCRAID